MAGCVTIDIGEGEEPIDRQMIRETRAETGGAAARTRGDSTSPRGCRGRGEGVDLIDSQITLK